MQSVKGFFFKLLFHLHCTFSRPVLRVPPCPRIHIVSITHDVMLESAGSAKLLEHLYLTKYYHIPEALVCKNISLELTPLAWHSCEM
jgi:hypothetical protein